MQYKVAYLPNIFIQRCFAVIEFMPDGYLVNFSPTDNASALLKVCQVVSDWQNVVKYFAKEILNANGTAVSWNYFHLLDSNTFVSLLAKKSISL